MLVIVTRLSIMPTMAITEAALRCFPTGPNPRSGVETSSARRTALHRGEHCRSRGAGDPRW